MASVLPLTYYDKIIAAVAASLGGGIVAGMTTDYRLQIGIAAGALVATVFVYDALFRHPPVPAPSQRTKVAAVVWHVFLATVLVTTYL